MGKEGTKKQDRTRETTYKNEGGKKEKGREWQDDDREKSKKGIMKKVRKEIKKIKSKGKDSRGEKRETRPIWEMEERTARRMEQWIKE